MSTITHSKNGTSKDAHNEEEDHNTNSSHMQRRSSLRPSDRSKHESILPLSKGGKALLVDNVQESLPNTPAVELQYMSFDTPKEQTSSENDSRSSSPHSQTMPVQRPVLYRKGSTLQSLGTALNRLIPSKEKISEPDESALPSSPMTFSNPPKNKWRFVACCFWSICNGSTDGAPGALLPYIEEYYGISYSVVSLIWIATAVGYIIVAATSHKLHQYFDKRQVLALGCFISCIMYTFVSTGYKFPLIVVGFLFNGIGLAIVLSEMNVFLSRLEKASTALGCFHGLYGVGATISPLIATQFVNHGIKWHYFYLILLGLMSTNIWLTWWSFSGATTDFLPWDRAHEKKEKELEELPLTAVTNEETIGLESFDTRNGDASNVKTRRVSVSEIKKKSDLSLALRNKLTWMMSLFVFLYQGAEVSLGGWIVTFLLDYRHGPANSVGYVASGYWAGLTIGRLVLTRPMHRFLGARRAIIVSALLSILCIVFCWVFTSVVLAGFFCSLSGIFIGPTYPLMITLAARILPRKIQVVSLTICTAFGSSGGAIFPFLVGVISQFQGTYVVLPTFIALYSTMLGVWLCLPNIERIEKGETHLNFLQRLW